MHDPHDPSFQVGVYVGPVFLTQEAFTIKALLVKAFAPRDTPLPRGSSSWSATLGGKDKDLLICGCSDLT
jgi:hypothetical protein